MWRNQGKMGIDVVQKCEERAIALGLGEKTLKCRGGQMGGSVRGLEFRGILPQAIEFDELFETLCEVEGFSDKGIL